MSGWDDHVGMTRTNFRKDRAGYYHDFGVALRRYSKNGEIYAMSIS